MKYMTTYKWGKLIFSKDCEYTVETYDVSDEKMYLWRGRFFTSGEIKKIEEQEIKFSPRHIFLEFIWITPSYIDDNHAEELYHLDVEHARRAANQMWSNYFNFLFHSRSKEDYEPMLFNIYTNQGQVLRNVNAEDFQLELRDYENKKVGEHETMMILGFEEIDSNFYHYDFEKKLFSDTGDSKDHNKDMLKKLSVTTPKTGPGGCCGGGNK